MFSRPFERVFTPVETKSSLASKFAYGQAVTSKQNEFERATALQPIIKVVMSHESFNFRNSHSSADMDDIDEQAAAL